MCGGVCSCSCAYTEVARVGIGVGIFFPSYESQGSNSGHQTWQQVVVVLFCFCDWAIAPAPSFNLSQRRCVTCRKVPNMCPLPHCYSRALDQMTSWQPFVLLRGWWTVLMTPGDSPWLAGTAFLLTHVPFLLHSWMSLHMFKFLLMRRTQDSLG